MHCRNPDDGNAGSTWPARAEQTLRFLQPVGVDAGLQQREFDQVVLRTATADAFVLPNKRAERRDHARKIAAFEGQKAARQHRELIARRVMLLPRQLRHLAGTGVEHNIILHDSLGQDREKLRAALELRTGSFAVAKCSSVIDRNATPCPASRYRCPTVAAIPSRLNRSSDQTGNGPPLLRYSGSPPA